jgi:hypothetical protein
MNEESFSKYRVFFYFAFAVIAIIFVSPFFLAGFGCADDFQAYMIVRLGKIWSDIVDISSFGGRFYYLLVRWFSYFPYLVDDMFFTKMFQMIPILVAFVVFAWLLYKITKSKAIAWFSVLVFLMASQGSTHTNLFYNYPLYYSLSFTVLVLSIILLLDFYNNGKKSFLVFSVVLFAFGLLFYETYLLFLLFAFLIIFSKNMQQPGSFGLRARRMAFHFGPYLLVAVAYLAAYLIYRKYHPSLYPGTTLVTDKLSIGNMLHVMWNLSVTSFPLTVYEANRWLCEAKSELVGGYSPVVIKLIMNAKIEWIIKGLLVAFCGYLLLSMMKGIKTKTFLTGTGFSILLIFTPHIPLAISQKYLYYVLETNMLGYVTTFFSLFGTMMFITFVIAYVMHLLDFNRFVKHAAATAFMVVFFGVSVITDFSNYTIAKDIRSANLRLYAVREYVKSEKFKAVPNDAVLFLEEWHETPSFYLKGLTEQGFDWSLYISAMNGASPKVVRDKQAFLEIGIKENRPMYYGTMLQGEKTDDVMIALARVETPAPGDSVISTVVSQVDIAYYSPYKIFTLNFRCRDGVQHDSIPFRINHINDKVLPASGVEMNVYNTKRSQPATIFTIEAPAIELKSLMISNMNNWGNKWYYL